jgi:hypothetical protein
MSLCLIIEHPDQSQEQAEQVMAHLRSTGPVPPQGARIGIGGPGEPGWRFVSLWDSEQDLQRFFADRLAAAYQQAGLSFENVKRTMFEVHTLFVADNAGVPQHA